MLLLQLLNNSRTKKFPAARNVLFIIFAVELIILSFLLAACGPQQPAMSSQQLQELAGITPTASGLKDDFRLDAGDHISVKFYLMPELNEDVTILPDGRINLQLVGTVAAAGLSPTELQQYLVEAYSQYFKTPSIVVLVREVSPQKIYVGGEVRHPKVLRTTTAISALQAIMEAGGFSNKAEISSIVVLRKPTDNVPIFMRLNLQEVLDGGTQIHDISLQNEDVVYVPKTQIASLNQFVDQYIRGILPFDTSVGFSWTYQLNDIRVVE